MKVMQVHSNKRVMAAHLVVGGRHYRVALEDGVWDIKTYMGGALLVDADAPIPDILRENLIKRAEVEIAAHRLGGGHRERGY